MLGLRLRQAFQRNSRDAKVFLVNRVGHVQMVFPDQRVRVLPPQRLAQSPVPCPCSFAVNEKRPVKGLAIVAEGNRQKTAVVRSGVADEKEIGRAHV